MNTFEHYRSLLQCILEKIFNLLEKVFNLLEKTRFEAKRDTNKSQI